MRVRQIGAIGVALALLIGLVTAVTIVVTSHPGPSRQVTGTAAGRPHRVSAAATVGRIVNGRFVPAARAASGTASESPGFTGPVPKAKGKPLPGSVPAATRPRPIKFPVRGKTPPETLVPARPVPPARKAGYNPKTSRPVRPTSADQVTYTNADGTRTAFDYENPVNYRKPDGQWATISTTLVPAGSPQAPAPASAPPSVPAGTSAPASASSSVPASATATFLRELTGGSSPTATPDLPTPTVTAGTATTGSAPTPSLPVPSVTAPPGPTPSVPPASPTASPSASGTPSAPAAPPASGWTQQSEAEPESFAPYANAPDLVTLPVDASHAVAFGVAGAVPVPGSAQGSTVAYAGVQPDSTLEFSAGTGLVKEQVVLAAPDAPVTWVFPLDLTGLTAKAGADGAIDFADASGKVVAYVPRGFMTDSKIDPHSGDGAMSAGVRYSLTTYQGSPAITMTLDASWLDSPDRVYPVTVDPSLVNVSVKDEFATSSTYVEYPDDSDFSGLPEVRVGTYDGGAHKAEAYLDFGNVGTDAADLKNDTILGVSLGVYNTWSYSCEPRPVYVYQVTTPWQAQGAKQWPGPATGAELGEKSFATGWVPQGSTSSPCPGSWEGITLNQAGTNLVNSWVHGAANYGLALAASTSDSYGWKKFSSQAAGIANPFLTITYTPDGASYQTSRQPIATPVTPTQNGTVTVKLVNTGSTTWGSGYQLSYEVYSGGKPFTTLPNGHVYTPAFTALPSAVGPGQSATVNATVSALPYGSYIIDFDMYRGVGSSPVAFSSEGIQPYAMGLNLPAPPTVNNVYPPTGYVAPTLAVQLSTAASSLGGTLTYKFTVNCVPVPGQICTTPTITSSGSKPYWTIPRSNMQWNTSYQWYVLVTSSNNASTSVGPMSLTTEVPQPGITSGLGGSSKLAYDPLSGNFTTSATDAAVATAGPALKLERTYNSMDPRVAGAFGAGWSTLIDASVQPDKDGTQDVTVTMPDGQEARFGYDGATSGTGSAQSEVYTPPFGSTDVLTQNLASGVWYLKDTSGNTYTFTSAGQISAVTDVNGLSESFTSNSSGKIATITNSVSNRTLTLTWGSTGGTSQHVTSVATQAPGDGPSPSTPLQWSYNYSGDELQSVCAPAVDGTSGCTPTCTTATACTQYSYGSGSEYRAGVLDSSPRSYWQLGDASGSTDATDEVDVNLGTADGTYSNVTLGQDPGPLAGSTETAATFNGTTSSVSLPSNLITDSTDVAIGLWFKTASSSASGVLFGYATDPLTSPSGPSDTHVPALYVGTDGYLHGELWNGVTDPISSGVKVNDGKWHYAVISGSGNSSGSSQWLYLDGQLVNSTSPTGQIDPGTMTNDTVGAGFWNGNWTTTSSSIGYFSGDIAQVAVYPHPLGPGAIAQQYALGTTATAEMTQVTLPATAAAPSGVAYQEATYDPATDRLSAYTDPNGGTWTIGLPTASGMKATSDALGEVLDRVTVSGPEGRQETYAYDMLDGARLVEYSSNGDTESYDYDAAGYLTTKFDADGNETCLSNDANGNALASTWYPNGAGGTPGGGTGTAPTCTVNATTGNCWSTTAPCTTYYTYTTYDTANPLDPYNNKVLTSSDGRSASSTDTTYRTIYTYNPAGQLTHKTTPDTTDFPTGRTTTYTYADGSQAAYNNAGTVPVGLLLSAATPGGARTTYQYYSNGDLAKVAEPSGRYTSYTYDALGRLQQGTVYTTTYLGGEQTSYLYNAMGQPVTVTYPGVTNQVTKATHTLQDSYSYDANGDLLSLTQADTTGGDPARVTSYTYDDHDQIATRTQPAGATTGGTSQAGANDNYGTSSATPDGATTSYAYDDLGNVSTRIDPNGNEYDYTYNEYNQPTQETLHTSSASQANPTPGCTAPATQDPTGCDLVLEALTYDPAGLLAATTDAMGRITNYFYDHDKELISVEQVDPCTTAGDPTCPTSGLSVGRETTYEYDGAGNRTGQIVYSLSGGTAGTYTATDYSYDAASRLTSVVTDPTPAPSTTTGYGQDGYANRSVSYTYNLDDLVTSKTVGSAAEGGTSITDYTYDTAGDKTSQTVVDGSTSLTTTWPTYDQNGQPLTMVAPDGNVSGGTPANYTTTYAYDPTGNLISQTAPPVQTQTYSAQSLASATPTTLYGYDTFGDQTQVRDPDLNVTTTAYDGDGRVTSVAQPSYTQPGTSSVITPTTAYAYDGDGNVKQVKDPDSNVTSYTYNALGGVTSMTQPPPAGQSAPETWTSTYDADGERLSVADPQQKASQATYDYFGEQATATDPLQNETQYAYDYLGDQVKVTSPDGIVTTSTYDHLGELTSTTDGAGDAASYEYGYAGQLTYAFSPDNGFTQYGYDQAGRLTSLSDFPPAGPGQATVPLRAESFGYDASGNQTSLTNWDGNTARGAYNAVGELTSQTVPTSSSTSITTLYGYDPAGNQTSVTGGNTNPTWTTYNPLNLAESVIGPATTAAPAAPQRTWTTTYDGNGNPIAVSQPGGVSLSYTYDGQGDLASQAGSGAAAATDARSFTYDQDGRLAGATSPAGTDGYTYFDNGELKAASGPSGASSYTYNGDGLVSSETGPGGKTGYTYDSADRLSTLSDPLTGATLTYSYNKDSLPASITYASGGTTGPAQTLGYDGLQRLTSDTVSAASGSVLASESYSYDPAGNLTSQGTAGGLGTSTTTYAYDQAGRLCASTSGTASLTCSTTGSGITAYAYDGDGNLKQAGPVSYSYNAQDQVTSSTSAAGTTSYGYTLNGALSSVTPPTGSAQSYTSDAYGDVVSGPGASYSYDALGRLAARTSGSSSTTPSYLGTSSLMSSDGSGDYAYDPSGSLVAAQAGGTGYATLSDQHGDLTALFGVSSSTTTLAASASYSPYGTKTGTAAMPRAGYQGGYTDPSTGLVLMGARWYNPATGSFVTNDTMAGSPLPSTADGNPYAYTSGNPLSETDPSGHSSSPGSGSCVGKGPDGTVTLVPCTGGNGGNGGNGGTAGVGGMCTVGFDWCPPGQTGTQGQGQGGTQTGTQGGTQDQGNGTGVHACGSTCNLGLPGGSGGGGGGAWDEGGVVGCNAGCGYQPPAPQPPPQDCYAVEACAAPPAPVALLDTPYVSSPVQAMPSMRQLAQEHRLITEKVTQRQATATGTRQIASSPGDVAGGQQPASGVGVAVPTVPWPTSPPSSSQQKRMWKLAGQAASVAVQVIPAVYQTFTEGIEATAQQAWGCAAHQNLADCGWTALNIVIGLATDGEEDPAALAACGGMSFTADTKVLLPDGKTAPISTLKPGDKVLATSTKTGKTTPETVTAVEVHNDTNLYDLTVKTPHGTEVIHTTSNHPFWDPHLHQWRPASKLKTGEHLKTPAGSTATADGGTTPKVHDGWMWDLTIPGNNDHDFYVAAGNSAVLVHNCGPQEFPNLEPENMPLDEGDAIFFGVTPAAPGTAAFDRAIATAPGGVIKWAVTKGLGLRIMPAETADTIDLYHSVLSGGDPVLAAGEAQIVRWEGRYYGRYITYHSGHFMPGEESLDIGINAFREAGIEFNETGSY